MARLGRWPIIVATLFSATLVQLNVGCNNPSWCCCDVGFPTQWFLWTDVSPLQVFGPETAINLAITLFAVVLLFGMSLPRNRVVWAQHLLTVLVASLFSWLNPWGQTYTPKGDYANAGFPYIFRYVTRLESPLFLMLNVLVALGCAVGLFMIFEVWIKTRSLATPTVSSNNLKRWAVTVAFLLLFVHANQEARWTGVPFAFDTPQGTRAGALVIDLFILTSLIAVPLRYTATKRLGSVLAFATFYVLANFDEWRSMKHFFGSTGGRGFPFSYEVSGGYDSGFLIANIAIGLTGALLIYTISSIKRREPGMA